MSVAEHYEPFDVAIGLVSRAYRKALAEAKAETEEDHERVVSVGGLHIIGTERHDSRRIDNQLRGRAGRQGDPGSSRFFLSLEDPLLRIFASDRVAGIMERLKMPEGEAIEHPWVTRAIENAQRKVEARNFDIRKQLLEYDDVSNDQRKVIYQQRNELLESTDVSEAVASLRAGTLSDMVAQHIPPESVEDQWDVAGLEKAFAAELNLHLPIQEWLKADETLDGAAIQKRVVGTANEEYVQKTVAVDADAWHQYERGVTLQSLDTHWREHLAALDHLRQGIHLRGYAQKNPKQEYKREAFELFSQLLDVVKMDVTRVLMTVRIQSQEEVAQAAEALEERAERISNVTYTHPNEDGSVSSDVGQGAGPAGIPLADQVPKVGRNDPCPCGSGKKYKLCHGRLV